MKGGGGTTEDAKIVRDLGETGGCWGKDSRNKLDAMEVPFLYVSDSSAEFGLHGRFVSAQQACIL